MGASLTSEQISEIIVRRYGDKVDVIEPPGGGPVYALIDRKHVLPVMEFLKNDPALRFDFLMDVTAVDHLGLEIPEIGERFSVVYQLCSFPNRHRYRVKTRVSEDDPVVPSVIELWQSALWAERETYDMFGIEFDGNPDMRRLLMPEDFPGFPLRKDYPLRGRGERDSFPQYVIEPEGSTGQQAGPGKG